MKTYSNPVSYTNTKIESVLNEMTKICSIVTKKNNDAQNIKHIKNRATHRQSVVLLID